MVSRFRRFMMPNRMLPAQTSSNVDLLREQRGRRKERAKAGAMYGFVIGVSAGLAGAQFSKTRQKVLLALGSAAAGAGLGTIAGLWKSRPLVRQATIEVGKALCLDWERNSFVKELVSHYPYLIVDSRGNLVGARTNPNRLGFGRLRLVTEKIRAGSYLKEKAPAPKIFKNFDLNEQGARSIVKVILSTMGKVERKKSAEFAEKFKAQLATDAVHDKKLEDFLKGTQYFFIDKKGDLVASKIGIINKLGLGRQRFRSKGVLEELGRLRWHAENFPNGLSPQ